MKAPLPPVGPKLPEFPPLPPARNVNCGVDLFIGLDIHEYAKSYALSAISAHEAEVGRLKAENAELRDDLQFVERWANHHGQKFYTTPQMALSCIQHYPPISAITRGYADGKVPETPNPYAEVTALREALEEIALAGMSPSPEMSQDDVTAWHARQAWRFIGIAARAISPEITKPKDFS